MTDWMRENWHVAVGVILALGIIAVTATIVCLPCLASVVGLRALSSFPSETPYTRPSATATASATATPSRTPTPVPLRIGDFATWGQGIKIGITEYSVTHACPGGYGEPAEGAKFIVIRVYTENVNQKTALNVPSLMLTLLDAGTVVGRDAGGLPCRYDEDAWGNACWQWGGKLYPDASCEGWEVFEVPENLRPEETIVRVTAHYGAGTASWRLGP